MLFLLAASLLFGGLEAGPYPVGFRVTERYDISRPYRYPFDLDGKPRVGNIARPMQISIWYPSKASDRAPMRLHDYVLLMGSENEFGLSAAEQQRRAEQAFFAVQILRDASPEQRQALLQLETRAVRDAEPATGQFPLIIWSLGSPALYQASAEYLASHGYAVAMVPRLPEMRALVDTAPTRTDFETKARDIAFLLGEMARLPFVDAKRVGVTGFSAGGRWALAEAMRNPHVRAFVSHDSVVLFDDDNGQFQQMPFVHPTRMRVPVLHMVRRAWIPRERSTLWQEMLFADRTHWTFEDPDLDHWDFASIGYASTLAGLRANHKDVIAKTFRIFNRATLQFFDKHVREKTDIASESLPTGFVTVSHTPATASFLVEQQFNEAVIDQFDRLLAAYRSHWTKTGKPPMSEAALNLAGYQLLALGRTNDAIRALSLNADAYPESANVYDSLSDAYLAAGDRTKALELAKKTIATLAKDTSADERKALIERSARAKISQLETR